MGDPVNPQKPGGDGDRSALDERLPQRRHSPTTNVPAPPTTTPAWQDKGLKTIPAPKTPIVDLDPPLPAPPRVVSKSRVSTEDASPQRPMGSGSKLDAFLGKPALIVLGICALIFIGVQLIPHSGGSRVFSRFEKQKLGALWRDRGLARFGGAAEEPALNGAVDRIGQRIAQAMDRKTTFIVAGEPVTAHAIVLPDESVVVTMGMLRRLSTEAQLASVLAHSMAHDVLHHTDAALDAQESHAEAARAAMEGGASDAAVEIVDLAAKYVFSPVEEEKADALAIKALYAAGYDTHALADAVTNLGVRGGQQKAAWLLSHPDKPERVQKLQAEATPGKTGDKEYEERVLTNLIRVVSSGPSTAPAENPYNIRKVTPGDPVVEGNEAEAAEEAASEEPPLMSAPVKPTKDSVTPSKRKKKKHRRR